MPKKNGDATVNEARVLLEEAMRATVSDKLVWFAIAWHTKDGTTIRARTKTAPKTLRLPA